MIISHRHQFIFIKTRKTAGTSLEIALSTILGDQDIVTPISSKDEITRRSLGGMKPQKYLEPWHAYTMTDLHALLFKLRRKARFYNHSSARDIQARIDREIWESYYKFCFERNPWDKVISLYYWCYQNDTTRPTITEFINADDCKTAINYGLYTINDEIAVDFIGKYERIEDDIHYICEHLNLPALPSLPRAKSEFRKDKRGYRDILSIEDSERISSMFAKEISLLGYEF